VSKHGFQTYVGKEENEGALTKAINVSIADTFDKLGFGMISLSVKGKSSIFLALNIDLAYIYCYLVNSRIKTCKL
jgi:hypothetical protein